MMLADTTFLIDFTKGKKEALAILNENDAFLTTQINMFEFIRGLFQRKISKKDLDEVMQMFENIRVLQLDDDACVRSAHIWAENAKSGKQLPTIDCLIAGIALTNGIKKIITQNSKHFEKIKGLKTVTY